MLFNVDADARPTSLSKKFAARGHDKVQRIIKSARA